MTADGNLHPCKNWWLQGTALYPEVGRVLGGVCGDQLVRLLHASGSGRRGDDVVSTSIQAANTLISQCAQSMLAGRQI